MRALDQLGFLALSRLRGNTVANGHEFVEIPVTLDLYNRRAGNFMRPRDQILGDLLRQIDEGVTIGLLLHHPIMGADAFALLENLLDELASSPSVRFHTFRGLVRSHALHTFRTLAGARR